MKNASKTQRHKNFKGAVLYPRILVWELAFLRKEIRELRDPNICVVIKETLLCSCCLLAVVVAAAVIVVQNIKLHKESFHNYYS